MIPSTSKLVLLYMLIELTDISISSPAYYDFRQNAKNENVYAGFAETEVIVVPEEQLNHAAEVTIPLIEPLIMSLFEKKSSRSLKYPPEFIKLQYGFIRPEKSPYKVDLEASMTPITKVDAVAPQIMAEQVEENINHKLVEEHIKENPEVFIVEEVTINKGDAMAGKKEKKEMKESEETLYLVQEGMEECGPDGHRDRNGICVYNPVF